MDQSIAKVQEVVERSPLRRDTLNEADSEFITSARETLQEGTAREMPKQLEKARSTQSSTANAKPAVSVSQPGWKEMETIMNQAERDIDDPYRGLLSTQWNTCEWGGSEPSPLYHLQDLSDPATLVRHVGYCSCPSLIEWTKEKHVNDLKAKRASRKKRKQRDLESGVPHTVGSRTTENDYECPCDYNPICLCTLGGVVDDILLERCQTLVKFKPNARGSEIPFAESTRVSPSKVARKESTDAAESHRNESPSKQSVEVVDLDMNGPEKTDDPDESNNVDTFAFMGTNQPAESSALDSEDTETEIITNPLRRSIQSSKEADPATIFTDLDLPQQSFSTVRFSENTKTALERLRQSLVVEEADIRSYVFHTLGVGHMGSEEEVNLGQYMAILRQWNRMLEFMNPVDEERTVASDHISLSIPPGIQNLGATCYLNTQLQCLAQNPVFLQGIFSWQVVNANHSMNYVMTKLQKLLAQMYLGGDCKLTTLDFSDALGLEHDEQQDPNEFARLLFERMEESFQQSDNNGNLANLLQRIFHGVTTYETVCMTCGNTSARSEGFMDLNLPIAKRTKAKRTGTIKDAFAKHVDTDVQHCLDQYCCAEMLDGDNQYFCSKCNCKRDAKRTLKLDELPPVLNIQLSRYVFDRAKFVKKKLTDKVLLPRTLSVEKREGPPVKYLLCAVMRHQGTSAYSGHYVAEAMDWLTGKWFEFNDETVEILPGGPSCSFDPDQELPGLAVEGNKTKAVPIGSQDAYNMYYVEEKFLSSACVDAIEQREELCTDEVGMEATPARGGVLEEVGKERQGKYWDLSEMCLADGRESDRLSRRKAGIRKYMLPDAGDLTVDDFLLDATKREAVWVSTDFLREYFRCEPDSRLDGVLVSQGPVIVGEKALCKHAKLDPEQARRGKRFPKDMFDALVALVKGERALLREQTLEEVDKWPIHDAIIEPDWRMSCKECSQLYRTKLSTKLNLLEDVADLFDEMDLIRDDSALYIKEGEVPGSQEESFAYLLSRQTITKFRKSFVATLKSVASFQRGGKVEGKASSDVPSVFDGLGSLDLSSFQFDTENPRASPKEDDSKAMQGRLDAAFNGNISCPHGKCNVMKNGRVVRFVPWRVWQLVKKVFPKAIEHKRKRAPKNGGSKTTESEEEGCPYCQAEKDSVENLKEELHGWATHVRENRELKALLRGNWESSSELEVHNFTNAANGCRLVHRSDIQAWRKTVTALVGVFKMKADSLSELIEKVEKIAFPNHHSVVFEFEREPVDKLVASLRPLVCRKHNLVIKEAVFAGSDAMTNARNNGHLLSKCIAVLSDEEHSAYIASLEQLLTVIVSDRGVELGTVGSPVVVDRDTSFLSKIENYAESNHPSIRQCGGQSNTHDDDLLRFSLDGSSKEFILSPGICNHATCTQEFSPPLEPVGAGDDERIESVSVDSFDRLPRRDHKTPKVIGAAAADPILVESDLEEDPTADLTFSLRAFEVEQNAILDTALAALQTISALPSEVDSTQQTFLRRSSRKRILHYPKGSLLSEDSVQIAMYHNVAALRLLLFEKCDVPLSGIDLTLVLVSDEETSPWTFTISSDMGRKSLLELVETVNEHHGVAAVNMSFEPSKDLLLLYQKQQNSDTGNLHETLMESLLQVANIYSSIGDDQSGNTRKRKQERASERGFRGTLLQSAAAPADNNPGASNNPSDSNALPVSDEEGEQVAPTEPRAREDGMPSDSDSNEILNRSPSFQTRRVSTGCLDETEHTNAQAILDEESPGRGVANAQQESTTEALRTKVLTALLSSVDEPANQSQCWDAVDWALGQNPMVKSHEGLLDIALAKYLSYDQDLADERDSIQAIQTSPASGASL